MIDYFSTNHQTSKYLPFSWNSGYLNPFSDEITLSSLRKGKNTTLPINRKMALIITKKKKGNSRSPGQKTLKLHDPYENRNQRNNNLHNRGSIYSEIYNLYTAPKQRNQSLSMVLNVHICPKRLLGKC